ncbi:hypothetical protein J4N45_05015 [Vibrio sp. SCSIO 43140]|uniref:hypothetical protein n=1 Tax=Vibrio sp. SCSIO 43140 TaxID=2819100 RepID=UPI002075B044|nr:hypothetical protein [Vibrio sp. SCSIO 43140]USD61330.1 hypothetical protein J4N45_05015 [Vibrio sp. SCSIO 43140]
MRKVIILSCSLLPIVVFASNDSKSLGVEYAPNSNTVGVYFQNLKLNELGFGMSIGLGFQPKGDYYSFSEQFGHDVGDDFKGYVDNVDVYLSPFATYGISSSWGLTIGATLASQTTYAEFYDKYHILGYRGHYYVEADKQNNSKLGYGANIGVTYTLSKINFQIKYDTLLGSNIGIGYVF